MLGHLSSESNVNMDRLGHVACENNADMDKLVPLFCENYAENYSDSDRLGHAVSDKDKYGYSKHA